MTHAQRVVVIGMSGAGKTTVARAIAQLLGAPHVELDALYWDADWQPKMPAHFRELVAQAAAGEHWVAEGNFSSVRTILWPRATTLVWLNLPFHVVFWRVLRRTMRRVMTGERLWHGNRESLRRTFFSRESILWWAISTYRRRRNDFERVREAGTFPHLHWIELRSRREVQSFLQDLAHDLAPAPGGRVPVRADWRRLRDGAG